MTKGKGKPVSIQNKALYSRISFLHQAASYFATAELQDKEGQKVSTGETAVAPVPAHNASPTEPLDGMQRRLVTDLRAVSQKARIRISPAMKRTVCKFCDTVLVEGKSCVSTVENKSKGGKKPWADMLVLQCKTCGREKRFPIHPKPKLAKSKRQAAAKDIPHGKT